MHHLLRLWFGITAPVGRAAYAYSGVGLMLFKYGVEALVIWFVASAVFLPWHFLNPVLSSRVQMLHAAPVWMGWMQIAWSLPFLWIAISMSVRRSADSGYSPWLGLLVLVPVINLAFMLTMCVLPSKAHQWSPQVRPASEDVKGQTAVLALGVSLLCGAVLMIVCIYLLESYSASMFLGTPLTMGAVASYLDNRQAPHQYLRAAGMGLLAVVIGGVGLLLFALEGLICVVMAMPLMLPLGALGGILGKAIADSTRRAPQELLAAVLALPLLAVVESRIAFSPEYEVMTVVEVEAPADVVWEQVIRFPDLPPPREWYFRTGIACPVRAHITGTGVGATRYCEFTTGTFVEPITVWEPARRLAFDVKDQPAPLFELSPYRHIHPPHLDGFLRSNRGEFLLTPLPSGRTRLEGRTWYEFDMFPQAYWTLWSHLFIHRIHERVLRHIKQRSEASLPPRFRPD